MRHNIGSSAFTGRPPTTAEAQLIALADGMRISQAIYVAAELRIADLIAGGLVTSAQIAEVTKTDPSALNRLLRALCAFRIFSEDRAGHFALSEIGLLLRTDTSLSFRDAVLFMTGPTRWRCWAELLQTVRTGLNRPEASFGMHLFDFYAMHPAESEIEANAMRAFSSSHLGPLVDGLELRDAQKIVDVGGGSGQFLAAILTVHHDARGILFDLPEVVKRAPEILSRAGVRDRCEIQSGSFFEGIPAFGDVYLLKQILHDWDDDRAVAILDACRSKLRRGAKLIVIERCVPEQGQAHERLETFVVDLEMLVMTPGGRERTEREFRALFERAGLQYVRTIPTETHLVLFESQRCGGPGRRLEIA
jgi:precorrin-6B methylase 2